MGFEALLGNERLKENLTSSLRRGHISHFYLICGPAGSGKHTLAKMLSAAILCGKQDAPCGHCTACRKVFEGNHPDFITVVDPEHKNIAVKIVREIRDDMFIRPNEAEHKIYLFAQDLGIEGQNALLKVLEEPPSYGVFMLLTDNPEKILPTVRSRCTELNLLSLPAETLRPALVRQFPDASKEDIDAAMMRSGGFLGQAQEILAGGEAVSAQTKAFAESFAARDILGLTQVLVPMQKMKRDQLIDILSQWVDILESALTARSGMTAATAQARLLSTGRSSQELMTAIRDIQKAVTYAQSNVSPAAVCGWLEWALRV
jgi:DNA polymerase-3 subunit delta'